LQDKLKEPANQTAQEFRSSTIDIDATRKSERPEWGQAKYQPKYRYAIQTITLTSGSFIARFQRKILKICFVKVGPSA
jgi:hypothetical protein